MMDYIRKLRLCIKWFKEVEGSYILEQEKLQNILDCAERKCNEMGMLLHPSMIPSVLIPFSPEFSFPRLSIYLDGWFSMNFSETVSCLSNRIWENIALHLKFIYFLFQGYLLLIIIFHWKKIYCLDLSQKKRRKIWCKLAFVFWVLRGANEE